MYVKQSDRIYDAYGRLVDAYGKVKIEENETGINSSQKKKQMIKTPNFYSKPNTNRPIKISKRIHWGIGERVVFNSSIYWLQSTVATRWQIHIQS